ncbi:hypothetical protein XENTR_v10004944 [Xenopus tropicalis]|nr:hypothetical protein XENTR_v10004944 [Xenopus tropicalis]
MSWGGLGWFRAEKSSTEWDVVGFALISLSLFSCTCQLLCVCVTAVSWLAEDAGSGSILVVFRVTHGRGKVRVLG